MWNAPVTLENSLAVLQNIKHRVTICPSNFTPSYISKRNENICQHKNLYTNIPSSIIHLEKKK